MHSRPSLATTRPQTYRTDRDHCTRATSIAEAAQSADHIISYDISTLVDDQRPAFIPSSF